MDVAFALRELKPDSVPVNFLMPFEGTPLGRPRRPDAAHCLRVLAMFRFVFPDVEVRIAGGREMHLRSLQPLGLHIANSIFLGDYLTSEGAPGSADLQMIADAGFVVEGAPSGAGPATVPAPPQSRCSPPGAGHGLTREHLSPVDDRPPATCNPAVEGRSASRRERSGGRRSYARRGPGRCGCWRDSYFFGIPGRA